MKQYRSILLFSRKKYNQAFFKHERLLKCWDYIHCSSLNGPISPKTLSFIMETLTHTHTHTHTHTYTHTHTLTHTHTHGDIFAHALMHIHTCKICMHMHARTNTHAHIYITESCMFTRIHACMHTRILSHIKSVTQHICLIQTTVVHLSV